MFLVYRIFFFFFFNDTATTEIYTLSLHDALPICTRRAARGWRDRTARGRSRSIALRSDGACQTASGSAPPATETRLDRKSTRLNSSHDQISYAVFCLKKKKKTKILSTCTLNLDRL